jgi:hypothetical protein
MQSEQSAALSQDAIALAFAEQHVGRFKYLGSNARLRWYVWNDATQRWENDATLYVRDCIRALCRSLAPEDDPALAREMCSANFIWGVEQLAGIDRRLAASRPELGLATKARAKRRAKVAQP